MSAHTSNNLARRAGAGEHGSGLPAALALLGPLTQRKSDLGMPVPSAIVMVAGDNYSAK